MAVRATMAMFEHKALWPVKVSEEREAAIRIRTPAAKKHAPCLRLTPAPYTHPATAPHTHTHTHTHTYTL